jgi:hypothetical protein
LCTRERAAASFIAGWVRDSQHPVLIAIDTPLGWPKPLAETLINHRAGMPIETAANAMFRRTTDVFIQQKLKKTPLDVGADRITRTAYAALAILGTLRAELGMPIPLAWAPADVSRVAAIEVYPAATLVAHRVRSIGYKSQRRLRSAVRLSRHCARSLQLANQWPI